MATHQASTCLAADESFGRCNAQQQSNIYLFCIKVLQPCDRHALRKSLFKSTFQTVSTDKRLWERTRQFKLRVGMSNFCQLRLSMIDFLQDPSYCLHNE